MFATLLGGLPRPPLPDDARSGDLVAAVVGAQEAAGLEPLVDGGLWRSDELGNVVERWYATSALTDRPVKAVILGPWSATSPPAGGVEADALDGLDGLHASLAITGGSAEDAGIDALLGAHYSSLALDLVRGPDNWRIAAAAPQSIGIVCGAMTAEAGGDEAVEILLYALRYAASTASRGPDRVGLATAGSLADVPWVVAERRMRRLGEAVRLAVASPDERAAVLDPRAISIRSAALGRAGVARRAGRPGPS